MVCNLTNVKKVLPGQYFDSEANLHYNHFRYYDPGIGRYITSDPIGLVGGSNSFLYARSNPLLFVDPDALVTLAVSGDVTFVPGLGLKVGGGAFFTTGDGSGTSSSGTFATDGALGGGDIDAAVGFSIVGGDLSNFEGSGQSLGFDFGPISIDLLFGADESFVGVGVSLSTPLPGISFGRTTTTITPIKERREPVRQPLFFEPMNDCR